MQRLDEKTIIVDVGTWEDKKNKLLIYDIADITSKVLDAIRTFCSTNQGVDIKDNEEKIKEIWISGSYTRWVECMERDFHFAVRCLKAVIEEKIIFTDDASNNHNCEPLIAALKIDEQLLNIMQINQINKMFYKNHNNWTWSSLFEELKKQNLFDEKILERKIKDIEIAKEAPFVLHYLSDFADQEDQIKQEGKIVKGQRR